jgi:hypothetical protein
MTIAIMPPKNKHEKKTVMIKRNTLPEGFIFSPATYRLLSFNAFSHQ